MRWAARSLSLSCFVITTCQLLRRNKIRIPVDQNQQIRYDNDRPGRCDSIPIFNSHIKII